MKLKGGRPALVMKLKDSWSGRMLRCSRCEQIPPDGAGVGWMCRRADRSTTVKPSQNRGNRVTAVDAGQRPTGWRHSDEQGGVKASM